VNDPVTTWTLRATYGLVPIVAGLDKFLNLLTDWTKYLSPMLKDALPVAPSTFMGAVGVIEIAAGALVLARVRYAAFIVAAWLVAIALNLLVAGAFDVAVRDLVMAVGAFALGRLEEAQRVEAPAPARALAHA
jgi:uncharacterized membrane protein YphA (DoxX/SURF4 family)